MYRIGKPEIDAVTRVIESKKLFRYAGGECARFELRYAKYLGVPSACMTSSGTAALTAALTGLGIGPGDEVIVPAHTYMATAVSVLAVGAIPVIVDIDDSITLDPAALDDAIGPQTRAVIPVHMWGLVCDMDAIMKIARKRKLWVVEDACQCVGGGYEGKKAGAIGHAGAFSFNYFKNMTCGEGGAVVAQDDEVARRARCAIDCCGFYWKGRGDPTEGFTASGSRASEIEGAILNAQLDQIDAIIKSTRRQKKQILKATARTGLVPAKANSIDYECGAQVVYALPSAEQAQRFGALAGGTIIGNTGRHTYTEWDPILNHRGAAHPAMNPFNFPANRKCRRKYSKDMCPRSLDILARAVMIPTHPDRTEQEVRARIQTIKTAAAEVLGHPKGAGQLPPAPGAGSATRRRLAARKS